ncbi:flavin-containing monooxygenase [Paracoccaceae bacterium GXU_MW_L88]
MTEIVIVGAGPAGLAVAACLQREGKKVRVLEKGDRIALRWYNHYDRLHLHTAREYSGLPFHPIPDETPRYPRREDMIDYLEAYADEERIKPEFGVEVKRIAREDGRWSLWTSKGPIHADFVVIASGFNSQPERPYLPGEETFPGTIIHSSEYRNAGPFENQRALILGFGNSGADIAVDLAEGEGIPTLSIRGPVQVIPRDVMGIPAQRFVQIMSKMPQKLMNGVISSASFARFGTLKRYGLTRSKRSVVTMVSEDNRIPVIDVGVMSHLRRGSITVRPGVDRIDGDLVRFSDGTTASYDAIILATGFRDGLERIVEVPEARMAVLRDPRRNRAQFGEDGLYSCGLSVSIYGMLYEINREAPLIAKDIAARSASDARSIAS